MCKAGKQVLRDYPKTAQPDVVTEISWGALGWLVCTHSNQRLEDRRARAGFRQRQDFVLAHRRRLAYLIW